MSWRLRWRFRKERAVASVFIGAATHPSDRIEIRHVALVWVVSGSPFVAGSQTVGIATVQKRGILHGMDSISLTLATFTPAEMEKITGVSQATQRDWRRRELTSFETRKGRKRFTSEDLAHLVVMKQLLPHVRPAVAYHLALMSCGGPIKILADQDYPSGTLKIEGKDLARNKIERFAVYTRFMDRQAVSYFPTSDLNSLPKRSKEFRPASAKNPVAFYVVVDLSEVADKLRYRAIKPYFVPVKAGSR